MKDIAQAIIDEDGDKWLDADPTERMENFRERAYAYELAEQHRVTERFGTTFECWFSERSLYVPDETGESAVDRSLAAMDAQGLHLRRGSAPPGSSRARSATRRTACSSRPTAR